MNTSNIKPNQPEARSWSDIEGDFNHVHFTAEAVTGLLDSLINQNNGEPNSINANTLRSATYTAHTGVTEMRKHFEELLNVHVQLVRSIKDDRPSEIDEINAITDEFENECPQLRKEAKEAILKGTSLKEFQCTALHMISLALHKLRQVENNA